MRKFVRGLYARFVPEAVQMHIAQYGKAIVAGSGSIIQFVNLTVPDYSDEVQWAVGAVAAVLTYLGVRQVKYRNEGEALWAVDRRRKLARR